MIRISFSQLESARKDPKGYAKSLSSPNKSSGRFSKNMAWQLAIYHYHKENNDLQAAYDYFEKMFFKNFANTSKNKLEFEVFVALLQDYIEDYEKNNLTYIEHKKRVSIPLTPKIRLGGEIPLINMNSQLGYSIFFFEKDNSKWANELRFPIVQYYVANTLFNVGLEDVQVGIFELNTRKHLCKSFVLEEVNDSISELKGLGNSISLLI